MVKSLISQGLNVSHRREKHYIIHIYLWMP